MAGDQLLFLKLAEALSKPSKAYRAAQAGLDIPEEALRGYLGGTEAADKIKESRLQGQTLSEILGTNAPPGLGSTTVRQANAITKPVEAYAALTKALTEKPQKYQQGSFLVNGQLTRFDPISGQYETADTPGKAVPIVPGIPNKPSNAITGKPEITPRVAPTIPTTESDKLADLNAMKEALGVVHKNFSPDFVGPINSRLLSAKQTSGVGATTQGALFTQSVQDIKDRLLRARSGAQINEQEYQRLVSLVPDQYKSVPDFLAKLDRFNQVLDTTISSKRQELMRAGYRGASTLPSTTSTSTISGSSSDPLGLFK